MLTGSDALGQYAKESDSEQDGGSTELFEARIRIKAVYTTNMLVLDHDLRLAYTQDWEYVCADIPHLR